MRAAQTEIYADPDVMLWDGLDEIRVGCRDGGWFSLADQGAKETVTFTACAFVPDLPLTGLGSYDFATGGVHWSVTFPDGELTYDVTGSTTSVSGHWNGQAVNQSE